MPTQYILPLDDPSAGLETVGGKGASLARLVAAGLPVPGGFHVTTAAYRRFVVDNHLQPRILAALESVDVSQPATLESASKAIHELFLEGSIPSEVAAAIARAYLSLPGEDPAVAVRSSATAEDLPDFSFAGQQETFLNIHGVEPVLQAVKRCWASLWTARAIGYRERNHIDQDRISLGVVVQSLVPADAAGILFTANPLNGQRDQAMISAAWGLGEAIVSGLVTPDTLVLDKSDFSMLTREIADKQVMTVLLEGGTAERPVSEDLRLAPVLDDDQAMHLVRLGLQIEASFGTPMDIEWAWLDGEFSILQARPITTLPEPGTPLQIEWDLPDPKGKYMRASIVDILPDPVSPLFKTLGIPTVRFAMFRMGKEITHVRPVLAEDYFTTINDYVYMNAYIPPRSWFWILAGLLPAMPGLMLKGARLYRDTALPRYAEVVDRWQDRSFERMPEFEVWEGVHEILDAAMDYLTTLMFATMGASAGSEGLFTGVYNKLIQKQDDPPATTFLMGYDSLPIQSEKSLYNLAIWCRERETLAAYLIRTPSGELANDLESDQPPAEVPLEDWKAFRQRFQVHLSRFGHIIYTLDFTHPLPLDQTEPMLETCKMYLRGEGVDPNERQRVAEDKRIRAVEILMGRVKGLRGWIFRKALGWAGPLAEVRETALANIGLGYPLLRRMLRELGSRFVQAGALDRADDIYWLEVDEVERGLAALQSGVAFVDLSDQIRQRKAHVESLKRVVPPPILPPVDRIMGIKTEAFVAAGEEDQMGNTLKGVPTSGGKVTARACVLHGPEDFHRMTPGAVLVAGTTTPAWTPLFAMASAVVTDIGGPLSHGSIVAREYGIPAVMGVGVATRRIRDGQTITVDGSAGLVILENGKDG